MPLSLSFVLIHVVFSTKERVPFIHETVRPDLFAYLATVVRNADCECFRVGGIADDVHLAIRLNRKTKIAELVAEVKASSSKWMKTQGVAKFAWQRGYGVFSVGPADLEALVNYIDGQEAHHQKRDLQEEMKALLRKYGVEFDERYLWD
jgi:putative transposase